MAFRTLEPGHQRSVCLITFSVIILRVSAITAGITPIGFSRPHVTVILTACGVYQ